MRQIEKQNLPFIGSEDFLIASVDSNKVVSNAYIMEHVPPRLQTTEAPSEDGESLKVRQNGSYIILYTSILII